MNSEELFDLVIVGAGPAGAATAISALQEKSGLRVLLADKSTFPRDKPCGDGLGPGVVSALRNLNLEHVLADEVPISACAVFGPRGSSFSSELPKIGGETIVGYVVRRLDFDERLFREAVSAGAQVREGWRFTGLSVRDDSSIEVRFDSGEGSRVVHTKALVGADGANSRVRSALGVKRNSDRFTGIALRAYSEVIGTQPERSLVFEWSEQLLPAYAWYFPTSSNLVNIGLGLVVRDAKRRSIRLEDELASFINLLETRGVHLSPPSDVRTYLLPHGARLPKLAHGSAILVGDAGSMINPLSGEGIFYGMAAGIEVGRAVAGAQDASEIPSRFTSVERSFRKRFVWHYRSNYLASLMLRSKWWVAVAVRAASRDDTVLREGVQLLFGEGVLKLRTAFRILWAGRP